MKGCLYCVFRSILFADDVVIQGLQSNLSDLPLANAVALRCAWSVPSAYLESPVTWQRECCYRRLVNVIVAAVDIIVNGSRGSLQRELADRRPLSAEQWRMAENIADLVKQ